MIIFQKVYPPSMLQVELRQRHTYETDKIPVKHLTIGTQENIMYVQEIPLGYFTLVYSIV